MCFGWILRTKSDGLLSPPCLMYEKDVMEYGQDMVSKFASAFMQAKNPEVMAMAEVTIAAGPVGMATHSENVTMESDHPARLRSLKSVRSSLLLKNAMLQLMTPVG